MSNSLRGILAVLTCSLLTAMAFSSCSFRDDTYVDFKDLEGMQNLAFRVIGQKETDLSGGLPNNCYLPDGTRVNEFAVDADASDNSEPANGPRKICQTSSTTAAAMIQELLKYGNQKQVIEIVGTYPSINADGDSIRLSGKVMLPKGRKPKRLILVSHYTVCSDAEAPSNCFSLEGVLVNNGYGLVIPDYLGYGVTSKEIHPYLVMDLTARNVLDMYLAVRPWLEATGLSPEEEDINLMGYSQGGATTMAVQYLIENEYATPEDPEYVKIHRVFAGGGPYDVKATYERFVTTDVASYPVAVPLVLQGMLSGNDALSVKMTDLMQQWLYDNIDPWINSKRFTSAQINKMIGTRVTHELLTPEAMDQTSDKVAELYKAMTENSITSYSWIPEAPVYIMHSMDDETVPYTNATNAKSKWAAGNITYNFGHYGGHVMTALRFIYSVQTLLDQEEAERRQYE